MADNAKQTSAADFTPIAGADRAKLDDEKIATPSLTFLQDSWRRLRKNKAAMIALIILIILFILAFGSGSSKHIILMLPIRTWLTCLLRFLVLTLMGLMEQSNSLVHELMRMPRQTPEIISIF